MNYYIGIDGGGTKTAFACFDEAHNCVAQCELQSCHVLQVSEEEAVAILQKGVETVLASIDVSHHKVAICAGLAGYGKNQHLRKRIEQICHKSFHDFPYVIQNDGEIALAGAFHGGDGILIIAGTGTIALAKHDGIVSRSGGWGYLLGDEGSAYWIAKQLLQEYTKQCDGRHPRTQLVDYVKEACHLKDDYDIIPYVSNTLGNERDKIAKLALLVYDLAKNNDPAAKTIYENAAKEIAQMIHALAASFSKECHVSYAGGVWKAGHYLIEPLKKYLHDSIIFEEPMHGPVYGAQLIARTIFAS